MPEEELAVIRCEYVKTIYAKDDKSFMVVVYATEEGYVTAVGSALPTKSDVKVDLSGKWCSHNGQQELKVETWEYPRLHDVQGFVQFIKSLKAGIGAVKAKRIYDAFGDAVWDVIVNEPDKLRTVRGVSKTNITKLTEKLEQTETLQRVMRMFSLADARITAKTASRIVERLGDNAVKVIEENPYYLEYLFDEISFESADKIAMSLKKPTDAPERIASYARKAIKEYCAVTGSVCMPAEALLKKITETLELNGSTVLSALRKEFDGARLMASNGCFYLPLLYEQECRIARELARLSRSGRKTSGTELDTVIAEYEKANGIVLADAQKSAVRAVFFHSVSVITGGPGVGKTTVIKAILYAHKQIMGENSDPVLLAPTGKAAKRMFEATGYEASTIHSAVGMQKCGEVFDEDSKLSGNLIIVDEASMMDMAICSVLLDKIEAGSTVVFVGDIDQLPSVGPGNILADLIGSESIAVTRLSVIYRQSEDNPIIPNCHAINSGSTALQYGKSFRFYDTKGDPQKLFTAAVDFYCRCAEQFGTDDVCLLNPRRKNTQVSVQTLNDAIQARLNPPVGGAEIKVGKTVFRKGDKVMQTKNDDMIKNGDTGYIVNIVTEQSEDGPVDVAVIDFGDNTVRYSTENILDAGLDLAYANTVHKAQGMEYATVIIILTKAHYNLLRRKVVYTAVSRAKKNVVFFGEPKALDLAVGNTTETPRITLLKERIKYEFSKM